METLQKSTLEILLKQRQLAMWDVIVKNFEVSPELNHDVHKWIRKGIVSEEAWKHGAKRSTEITIYPRNPKDSTS